MADVHPVFAMDKITGKPMLIGTTYLSSLTERENQKDVIWFNDDVPDYNQYPITYELGLNVYPTVYFYATKVEYSYGSYIICSEKNEQLIQEMVEIVKNEPKYAGLFQKYEESQHRVKDR